MTSKPIATVLAMGAFAMVGACNDPDTETPAPAPSVTMDTGLPDPNSSPASILRSDFSEDVIEEPALEPLDATISFGEGGTRLSDSAREKVEELLGTAQMKAGGAIILRGHTDSAGYDEANLRASRQRAEAVAAMLEDNGIDADRIEIIALGEMRPLAPNANLDGTANESNRARNRRVDIHIDVPENGDEQDTDADEAGEDSAGSSGSSNLTD
ncbi:OmpA family protein [Croceicoccus hydrothermalis]|uniref:OmpA family protein n=1 Tax=Croceicoccus hydrothermalis TaxID=2867964 RepID=UPI001EFA90F8|nr:OmpA family protein [Croceicoccus hydrothermalis]